MGDKITFRGRGRGCIIEGTDGGVSAVDPRLRFKKGWLTGGSDPLDGSVECGEGTDFPMLVTQDELMEIVYRARDAYFTAGEARAEYADSDPLGTVEKGVNIIINPTDPADSSTSPSINLYYEDNSSPQHHWDRGFNASYTYGVQVFDTNHVADFDAEYTVDPSDSPASLGDTVARDLNTEKGMWIETSVINFYDPELVCAFRHQLSWLADSEPSSSIYTVYSKEEDLIGSPPASDSFGPAFLDLLFSGQVAYIEGDKNHPFAPNSQMYIGLDFSASCSADDLGLFGVNMDISTSSTYLVDDVGYDVATELNADLVFNLSGGRTVSCPLYIGDYSGLSEAQNISAVDFEMTVTKWWGYDGEWNTDTGEKI